VYTLSISFLQSVHFESIICSKCLLAFYYKLKVVHETILANQVPFLVELVTASTTVLTIPRNYTGGPRIFKNKSPVPIIKFIAGIPAAYVWKSALGTPATTKSPPLPTTPPPTSPIPDDAHPIGLARSNKY